MPTGSSWQAVPAQNAKIHSTYLSSYFSSPTSHFFFDEITRLCLKIRLLSDTSRKQLTSCCSTPSNNRVNRLHFSNEDVKRFGDEKIINIGATTKNKFVRTKMRLKLGTKIDLSERFVTFVRLICQILFSSDSMSFPRDFRDLKKTRDGRMDGWTDRPSYRHAWPHLKSSL